VDCFSVSHDKYEKERYVQVAEHDSGAAATGQGSDWLEGDAKLKKGIRGIFMKNVPDQMRKLKDALAGSDLKNAELLSHSIKGAAAMIGAPRLRDAAGNVEKACGQGDAGSAVAYFQTTNSEFLKVMEELERESG
jgi:HPt (histidine-containing phosphotransfer) domain-containing protein